MEENFKGATSLESTDVADIKKNRRKKFWGEVETSQSIIEEFGYTVTTTIRSTENVVVFLATNESDQKVAIKKITVPCYKAGSRNTDIDGLDEKIRAEMAHLSKIISDSGSQFVITYYDYKVVETSDRVKYDLYIRMDYLTSLQQIFKENDLTVRDLLKICIEICDSLEWCHQNGKVHNNINLNNIFVNDNKYLLGDIASSEYRRNETEYCIAPELFRGANPTSQSDIYALGMVMYVLLNKGLPPFASSYSNEDIEAAIVRLRNSDTPLPLKVNQGLEEVIKKALSPIEKRYTSVDEMRKALEYLEKYMPEEWLDADIKGVRELPKPEPQKKEKDKPKTKKPAKELAPEDISLRRKNIRDYIIIGLLLSILIVGSVLLIMTFGTSDSKKVYSLIESGSYALAFKEIEEMKTSGDEVDEVLSVYIQTCLDEGEYRRVIQAIPLLSEATYSNAEYYKDIILTLKNSGKDQMAKNVIEYLTGKSSALDEMISSLE